MKIKRRFIKSITQTAADMSREGEIAMPWERGARRASFIAKRSLEGQTLKRA